ncbi:hypothetical protein [Streptomyces sp. NPDC058145]|uniref:hypothetical protein n=1 Tax=Streptomyces sp. NPDC058145 TaxID=3346356 RepID=UPI0036EA0C2E
MEDRTVPDWRADAWDLERQHHEHYGKDAVVAVENTGPSGLADAEEQPVDPVRSPVTAEAPELGVMDAEVVDGSPLGQGATLSAWPPHGAPSGSTHREDHRDDQRL